MNAPVGRKEKNQTKTWIFWIRDSCICPGWISIRVLLGKGGGGKNIPYTIEVCDAPFLLLLLKTVFSVHFHNHRLTGIHSKGQFNFLCETSLCEGKRSMLLGFFFFSLSQHQPYSITLFLSLYIKAHSIAAPQLRCCYFRP